MARWLLVRHGETEWNAERRIQGHRDIGLSSVGYRQAQLLASRLTDAHLEAVYSSDLSRAKDTADAIAAERDVKVLVRPDLRERDYGQWQGLTPDEISARDPEDYARWRAGDHQFCPPGGESVSDVVTRVSRLAVELRERHPGEGTVLLAGHGGSLLCLLVVVLDLPIEARGRFTLANASLSALAVSANTAVLGRWNDISHWEDHKETFRS